MSCFKQLPIAHRIKFKLLHLAYKTFHELTLLVHFFVIPTSTRPAPSHPGSKLFVLWSDKDRQEALGCPHITCLLTSFVPITPRPPTRELSKAAPYSLQSYHIRLPFLTSCSISHPHVKADAGAYEKCLCCSLSPKW